MARVHERLQGDGKKTRMILQVHDELVFDLRAEEEADVREIVGTAMREAIALKVPVVVEIGVGKSWLEAH
jgi:DNA polymerase I